MAFFYDVVYARGEPTTPSKAAVVNVRVGDSPNTHRHWWLRPVSGAGTRLYGWIAGSNALDRNRSRLESMLAESLREPDEFYDPSEASGLTRFALDTARKAKILRAEDRLPPEGRAERFRPLRDNPWKATAGADEVTALIRRLYPEMSEDRLAGLITELSRPGRSLRLSPEAGYTATTALVAAVGAYAETQVEGPFQHVAAAVALTGAGWSAGAGWLAGHRLPASVLAGVMLATAAAGPVTQLLNESAPPPREPARTRTVDTPRTWEPPCGGGLQPVTRGGAP